jgi:glycosyltransferase involved in cell wall biosynthesis
MDLSVVIATTNAQASIASCLDRLERACGSLAAELIVVDASTDDTARLASAHAGRVDVVRLAAGTVTPVLWAEGYRRSRGRVVALTTGHCLASPGWATALLAAIDEGAAGAGGPLAIAAGTRPLDWAVYYLRYSAFTPRAIGRGRIAGEIAGDNAAYRRASLEPHAATFARGFWELDVHKLLRADGGWIAAAPDAIMEFGRSFPPRVILAHRYAHGRQFGAARAAGGSRQPRQIVAAAPLVPLVLWMRACGRTIRTGPSMWRFAVATPWFLILASAWALGEASGALRARQP